MDSAIASADTGQCLPTCTVSHSFTPAVQSLAMTHKWTHWFNYTSSTSDLSFLLKVYRPFCCCPGHLLSWCIFFFTVYCLVFNLCCTLYSSYSSSRIFTTNPNWHFQHHYSQSVNNHNHTQCHYAQLLLSNSNVIVHFLIMTSHESCLC